MEIGVLIIEYIYRLAVMNCPEFLYLIIMREMKVDYIT
jgi:hypothetical protein